MKSLTQLMCEFDTMSDKGEVLDAMYKSIMVGMSKPSIACVVSRICDFRGMIEGTFRQRQYMSIVKRFLEETGEMAIKVRLEQLLNAPLTSWSSVEERAALL